MSNGTKVEELNDFEVLKQKALVDIPSAVDGLEIKDDTDAAAATRLIQGINTVIRKIEDFFAPSKKAAHDAWKAVCANETTLKSQPMAARDRAQSKLNAFLLERRRRQEAAEREAREKAEAEERERRRIEEEKAAEDKALEDAARIEAAGSPAEAARIFDEALSAPKTPPVATVYGKPIAPPPPPAVKFSGVAERKKWYAEVVDFAKLPDEFKLPNMTLLNAVATTKKETASVEGVEFKWRIESAVGRLK